MLTFMARGLLAVILACFPTHANLTPAHIEAIKTITQLTGKYNEAERVLKVTLPRNDVKISIDGWAIPSFMGLTSWAAFAAGKEASLMVMGDLVLFEDEVNRVMTVALDSGLQVTALHNHYFFDDPKVYFMHIAGEETAEVLAKSVRACFDETKKVREKQKKPARSFGAKEKLSSKNSISPKAIEDILDVKGEAKDGMYKVVVGRKVTMKCGCVAEKDLGVNTWAAFAGTDANAVVDGDFAVLEEELQSVLKVLRKGNINIVAIHNHMVHETPRTLFIHYWGRGSAQQLARAVKQALNMQQGSQSKDAVVTPLKTR